MVKVNNIFGDIKKGKQDNAIYQLKYGQQIRRAAYKEVKDPSPRQITQRNLFKDAVEWVKSLTSSEKTSLKKYYRKTYHSWKPGEPSTWYNWAKTLVMKKVEFSYSHEYPYNYVVHHPAILKVEELSEGGDLLFETNNLSNINNLKFTNNFSSTGARDCHTVVVTTLPGVVYEFVLDVERGITITFPC